ncbi:hypothetical protein LO772_14935 [Yinghuangia sp. ASG 101]|uniref:hypothetical protein n=1 Tax=Yinghuangia sp. ASG 101 TaxID=2896848 RepID=UPI001E384EAA|nr:hypothetical protein [Yinghuangia sp. ASG 101]UGQ14750.1 hypothetical protein LO772_14935 [Yinghuangia sp. ASG 101]
MRRGKRRLAVTTAVLAVAWTLVAAGPASAGGVPDPTPGGPQRPYEPDVPGPRNIDTLGARTVPDGGTERGVLVAFDRTSRAEPTGPPAAARRFVFLFDRSLSFNPEAFPVCSRAAIEAGGVGACPEGSQVGSGTSHAYPDGSTPVLAFNTVHAHGGRGALVVVPANNTILELTWERVTDPYRARGYLWALDEILPPSPVPPGERVGTRRFELTWGATRVAGGRTVSFAEAARECGDVRVGLWSEFVTGQRGLVEARG